MGEAAANLIVERRCSPRLVMVIPFVAIPAALVACYVAFAWWDYQSSLARLTSPGSTICPDTACIAEMSGEYHFGFQVAAILGSLAIITASLVIWGLVIFATGVRESGFRLSRFP